MEEVEFVTLENNLEYIVLDKFKLDEQSYVLLTNSKNGADFCIRRVSGEQLQGLKDETEFNKVMEYYLGSVNKNE